MRSRAGSRRHGFTLVELLTVVAILGVLVTIMASVYKGVVNSSARAATSEMFEAINAALKLYYEDWGKYPYDTAPTQPTDGFAKVADTYRPIPYNSTLTPESKEASLYAALTKMRVRHGPYFRGPEGQVVQKKSGTTFYTLFADGWGRPILYWRPADARLGTAIMANGNSVNYAGYPSTLPRTLTWTDPSTPTGSTATFPVLESKGADEFNNADNLFNYGTVHP